MPIIHFINNKTQTAGGMKNVLNYVSRKEKIPTLVLMAEDAVTISFTATNTERRIWSMNSKQEELQQMYDKELSEAADTQPTVVVLDSNWRALIELNKLMSQEQLEILTRLSVLATKADTEQVLKTVRSEQRDTIATCRELLNQAAELSETAMAQLEKATADLSSQAGKLNEEYGLKLKELDEYKHKLRSKAVKWIVISQSVLIALSAALQLWLR